MSLHIHEFVELIEEVVPYIKVSGSFARCFDHTKRRCCGYCLRGEARHPREWFLCCRCCRCFVNIQEATETYLQSAMHSVCMVFLVLLNLWMLALYADFGRSLGQTIDIVSIIFQAVFVAELLLRIAIRGWTRFWWQPNNFYGERKARFDVIITVTMAVALVVVMALKGTKNITVSLDLTSGKAPSIALFDEWPLRKDEVVDSDW